MMKHGQHRENSLRLTRGARPKATLLLLGSPNRHSMMPLAGSGDQMNILLKLIRNTSKPLDIT